MKRSRIIGRLLAGVLLSVSIGYLTAYAEGKVLSGRIVRDTAMHDHIPGFHPAMSVGKSPLKNLERKHPWSLPTHALAGGGTQDTIHILVLRYNFQYETTDNPNTTGRGQMDLFNPFASPIDSANYYNAVGHFIDPPPHDSLYFDAHLQALKRFYEFSSHNKLTLTWDIFPPKRDSTYLLPQPMGYYGACEFDSVVGGLEQFFIDCITTADLLSPEIDFSQYGSIFIFHAGADRQNDIGFPETCEDLFTGFIRFGDSVLVDNDSTSIRDALLMPETASQDNRATALNAVIAHEFGHQLGLVDLYSTINFATTVGEFATMDHNGFKTGLDFGWTVGSAFGCFPVYHDAWSRAFLGFDSVYDFRQGTDIRIVAANMVKDGIKIARVPITEHEYYLIENRIEDTDGKATAVLADSATSVIQGPVFAVTREFTGEYDALLPGSGMLIYRIDETVAGMDYDGDGLNNFSDNDLQWDYTRKFMTLMEADGFENLTGRCPAGCGLVGQLYGWAGDMYLEGNNTSLTPNTNPPAIDGTGNNTHVRITNIRRDSSVTPDTVLGAVMKFSVETDGLVSGFPVRVGYPQSFSSGRLSPIVDDLNGDDTQEILVASGRRVMAFTPDGESFLQSIDSCPACPVFFDTALTSFAATPHQLPMFYQAPTDISAGPVTGNFGSGTRYLVAASYFSGGIGRVVLLDTLDANDDGQADVAAPPINTIGTPKHLLFGNRLWAVTDSGYVYSKPSLVGAAVQVGTLTDSAVFGVCIADSLLIVIAGDADETNAYLFNSANALDTIEFEGMCSLGPIAADIDDDGLYELVIFSPSGEAAIVTVNSATSSFQLQKTDDLNTEFTTAPIISDVDLDGRPDIIIGGVNALYAFNDNLILKSGYPIEVDDRFLDNPVDAAPIAANISGDRLPEVIAPNAIGNLYSFGPDLSTGFPLSAGERSVSSALVFNTATGGKLGYVGLDGWFYLWETGTDSTTNFWPMAGHDPSGSFAFLSSQLGPEQSYSGLLPEESFYNYPNPVTAGVTTIRYLLGQAATKVELKLYDLSGVEVATLSGTTAAGDNETIWNCSGVTPGVYRCMIYADFDGSSEHAFTDIAVIR